jgi:hypothetical protein
MRSLSLKLPRLATWLEKTYQHLRGKGVNYWLVVAFLIPLGMLIGDAIGERRMLIGPRYRLYRMLQNASVNSPTYFNRTAVVVIGDEEFWKGELARRTPLKRGYLEKLLIKLNSERAKPAVIAIDIDLRSQTLDKSVVEHSDYHGETQKLLQTIDIVSRDICVVLPRTLISKSAEEPTLLTEKQHYVKEPSIYDDFPFDRNKVIEGYVSLPYDIRQVPLTLPMKDSPPLDSFAVAIARVLDPVAVADAQAKGALPYGTFIAKTEPPPVPAMDVLNFSDDELKSHFFGKAVLIGGTWHEHAYGRGNQVDTHLTPVGELGGVLVHANYVDALVNGRTHKPLGKKLTVTIEVLLSVCIAVIFAWDMGPWKKLIAALLLSAGLIIITLFFWQNLGLFFDFSIPLILLGGHTVVEKVREWQAEARKYRQHAQTCAGVEA